MPTDNIAYSSIGRLVVNKIKSNRVLFTYNVNTNQRNIKMKRNNHMVSNESNLKKYSYYNKFLLSD